MRIMFYCQHVLGVGHFFRSMEIARALERHQVLFIEGGEPLADFTPPPHVKRVFLPPLMMDGQFTRVHSCGADLEAVKYRRTELLDQSLRNFAPDVLVIELFPFGRKYFTFELMPLLQRIRQENLPTKVVCSLRDILVEKKDQARFEEHVIRTLNACFDLLLIHSDPHVIPLDETFSRVKDIAIPLEYTGFVTRRPGQTLTPQTGLILISGGGSPVGRDLLACAIGAAQTLPDPHLRVRAFASPFLPRQDLACLERLAARDERSVILPFSSQFLDELAAAELSISMAGYNTCMDILSSGIKALVYPFPQNREQRIRAERLQQLGILTVLDSLQRDRLAEHIGLQLRDHKARPGTPAILQNGAANTAQAVEKYFGRS